jgi:hypothetical protein
MLTPYLPYPLQAGGELRLGEFILVVEFDDPSAPEGANE